MVIVVLKSPPSEGWERVETPKFPNSSTFQDLDQRSTTEVEPKMARQRGSYSNSFANTNINLLTNQLGLYGLHFLLFQTNPDVAGLILLNFTYYRTIHICAF